jgi:aminopeptidase
MDSRRLKYAKLLLDTAINLQPGQNLLISAEVYHWPFLELLLELAYQLGAGRVEVHAGHPAEFGARIRHSRPEYLERIPAWAEKRQQVLADEAWASLSLFGPTEPLQQASLDPERVAVVRRASLPLRRIQQDASRANRAPWCVGALPTPKWARMVFPDASPEQAEALLWEEICTILELGAEDPSAVWREKARVIALREQRLAELQVAKLLIRGPGTDLEVQCLERGVWCGGSSATVAGQVFFPNLPTEEVFTTPDYRRTSGRVAVTRPVEVFGVSVTGAWFRFEDGRVVEYGAEEHVEQLDAFFEFCPHARFAGEIALVDGDSPIARSGRTFFCILYDENASSHLALGGGYPLALPGGTEMSEEQLRAQGVNVSLLHTDFMIGSDETEVIAVTRGGEEVLLMRGGRFAEALAV